MFITNTPTIEGEKIVQNLGLVRGNTVRARNAARDLFAVFRSIVGGEIDEYTKLMSQSRDEAIGRMIANAQELGADAIVNVRFMTAPVMQGAAEIMAYGTAVKLVSDDVV